MTEEKTKKVKIKKRASSIDVEKMTPEEADAEMSRFFAAMEEQYKNLPDAELERGAKKTQDFIEGKIGWAELLNMTPEMLFQMAELGFTQFKLGRYPDAERIFKALTVLDRTNAYYHSVMGSILQRQKRFGEAIVEYGQAIELDPTDIVSFTNRGEIFLKHGLLAEAKEDFIKAIELDPDERDKFANRARMLMKEIERHDKNKEGKGSKGGK